ncbi:MAG: hypothetical protein Q7S74_06870 [Nanoarchaeota archaeon]|nr:hypothetical protein [Nanoarchaeota archaeon]
MKLPNKNSLNKVSKRIKEEIDNTLKRSPSYKKLERDLAETKKELAAIQQKTAENTNPQVEYERRISQIEQKAQEREANYLEQIELLKQLRAPSVLEALAKSPKAFGEYNIPGLVIAAYEDIKNHYQTTNEENEILKDENKKIKENILNFAASIVQQQRLPLALYTIEGAPVYLAPTFQKKQKQYEKSRDNKFNNDISEIFSIEEIKEKLVGGYTIKKQIGPYTGIVSVYSLGIAHESYTPNTYILVQLIPQKTKETKKRYSLLKSAQKNAKKALNKSVQTINEALHGDATQLPQINTT